jgi:hypothetical protein
LTVRPIQLLTDTGTLTYHPIQVLNYSLSADAAYGVMTHYWSTGEIVNWDTVVDYYVDGEATPSISLMEDMACGQGFPKAAVGIPAHGRR